MALNGLFCGDVPLRNYSLTLLTLSALPATLVYCLLTSSLLDVIVHTAGLQLGFCQVFCRF